MKSYHDKLIGTDRLKVKIYQVINPMIRRIHKLCKSIEYKLYTLCIIYEYIMYYLCQKIPNKNS